MGSAASTLCEMPARKGSTARGKAGGVTQQEHKSHVGSSAGMMVLVVLASFNVMYAWSGDAAPHKHKDQ